MTLIDDVRDWVGSTPDDDTIQGVIDRYDTDTEPAKRAALSILRRRRADLDGTGARSFSIDGDVSWGSVGKDALTGLDRKIAHLCGLVGEPVDTGLPALTSTPILPHPCPTA